VGMLSLLHAVPHKSSANRMPAIPSRSWSREMHRGLAPQLWEAAARGESGDSLSFMQARTRDDSWRASWPSLRNPLIDSIGYLIRIATIRRTVGSFAPLSTAPRVCETPQGCVGFVRAVLLRLAGFARFRPEALLDPSACLNLSIPQSCGNPQGRGFV